MGKAIGRRKWLVAVPLWLALSVFAADQTRLELPDHPELGIDVFREKRCIECHSIWNEGGKIGPDLSKAMKEKSFYQILGLFWNHFPRMVAEMKARGLTIEEMKPDELKHLVAYLYYLNYFDAAGEFRRGRTAFKERQCVNCHTLGDEERKIGPPLDKFRWMISPVYLGTQMWNHRPMMRERFAEKQLVMPVFEKSDLADLLAYIRGMSIGESEDRVYLEPGSPNRGKQVFDDKKCSTCHSVYGEGGDKAPDLASVQLSKGIAELTATLWNHLDKMEAAYRELAMPFPEFQPQEMGDLLTYLYFIRFFDEDGNVAAGEALFREKGCASCHGEPGKGGEQAPDLALSDVDFGSFEFGARIWNHADQMGKMFEEELIAWPTFKDNEMRDLIFYLRSKAKQK